MSARRADRPPADERRIEAALGSDDPVQSVRELIEEGYNRGISAGQMRERLGRG